MSAAPRDRDPAVSIVVPVLDEIAHLDAAIEGFDALDHPKDRLEVLMVDGGSTDGSLERLEQLRATRPWLHIVANPKRRASAAFNRGIEAATGEIVCIVGAHAKVGPDFVRRSIEVLDETGAAGVGGSLHHEGLDPAGRAIGLAMTSPFGMASPFRYGTTRREVDTMGHPVYRAEVLAEVGPFDESLERNSDYELNHRLRASGHRLVLEPSIVTLYRPRGSLRSLARQFHDYGRAKVSVLRRHPDSMKPRHLVPPALTVAVAAAPLLVLGRPGRVLVGVGAVGYAAGLGAAVAQARPRAHEADLPTFVLAFPVMHVAWGAGFLRGVVDLVSRSGR